MTWLPEKPRSQCSNMRTYQPDRNNLREKGLTFLTVPRFPATWLEHNISYHWWPGSKAETQKRSGTKDSTQSPLPQWSTFPRLVPILKISCMSQNKTTSWVLSFQSTSHFLAQNSGSDLLLLRLIFINIYPEWMSCVLPEVAWRQCQVPWVRVTGHEPCEVGAESQAGMFWKSGDCSQLLSHLSFLIIPYTHALLLCVVTWHRVLLV